MQNVEIITLHSYEQISFYLMRGEIIIFNYSDGMVYITKKDEKINITMQPKVGGAYELVGTENELENFVKNTPTEFYVVKGAYLEKVSLGKLGKLKNFISRLLYK